MKNRMSVHERFDNDPLFHSLVDVLTAFLMEHPDYTPTELREAAMVAACRVEALTLREYRMDAMGNLYPKREPFL